MGPISNIGPKTSRAARDRPELNLEAKFSRHNNLPEIVAGRRPHGGGRRQHIAQQHHRARCRASSCHSRCTAVRQPLDHRAAWCARPATSGATIALGGGQQSASHVHNDLRTAANLAGHCASSARPRSHNRARMMRRRTWRRPTYPSPGSDTTVGEPWRIRIPSPGITDSACKNQLVVVSVQYGPFNPYIPIRSTTIGKSRVAKDPIAMHTSWRSNSDIANNIGYPRMSASGESSTTMHRLLHASGSHPIPPPNDPNLRVNCPTQPHRSAQDLSCSSPTASHTLKSHFSAQSTASALELKSIYDPKLKSDISYHGSSSGVPSLFQRRHLQLFQLGRPLTVSFWKSPCLLKQVHCTSHVNR
ncbi:Region-like protein isoform 1 [Dorcoceras hygrometricum]|uniref:Region-like protein isoform 1 n=1 Tax=Dorcoceras hygrometricum TaxID=472368 RepID=A0A2Z7BCD9_9LAMI|nr:Region-like protein isoform 1 [Dorcoceras hygrometricum]